MSWRRGPWASADQNPAIAQVRRFPVVRLDDRELARGVAMAVEPFQVAKQLHFDALRPVVKELDARHPDRGPACASSRCTGADVHDARV
jgi:hypothetical protein